LFCDHSCSATYNNLNRASLVEWKCEGCSKIHLTLPYKVKKYCNRSCSKVQQKQDSFDRLKKGLVESRSSIRTILKREFENKCFECGISEWRGFQIPLEVDHIDGNAGNNNFNNLRLICPNCHSITATWKGRNKGNGRAARGLSLF
jgi:Zn finger protein HypA/HybF involved in hydrogenase expression